MGLAIEDGQGFSFVNLLNGYNDAFFGWYGLSVF